MNTRSLKGSAGGSGRVGFRALVDLDRTTRTRPLRRDRRLAAGRRLLPDFARRCRNLSVCLCLDRRRLDFLAFLGRAIRYPLGLI